ncbi:Mn-containing catalase [Inquilinus ginsengisoli]|uniref:manganese catalase family protein n=1 Tax=Inquilinus ginsengisoli TaxID=363840 RepID=UPI003D204AEB
MFIHIKQLQFNARVSEPDPRFARLLLEQFGGGNGELKAAMQYFVQAYAARKPYPDKYDLLMDTATEELSHLEIVGATITMLLKGVNGELKNALDVSGLPSLAEGGSAARDSLIHEALAMPHFATLSGGGPLLEDSQGNPWSGAYVNANGDLTVDLRSNIAAESRAKIVYEYLLKFTDDPYVRETLRFLMTREITHFRQFEAALETIQPNFPPGILQGDPRHVATAYNMSQGEDQRGPWNEGAEGPFGRDWLYVADPVANVGVTQGEALHGDRDVEAETDGDKVEKKLSQQRSGEISAAEGEPGDPWTNYDDIPHPMSWDPSDDAPSSGGRKARGKKNGHSGRAGRTH